MAVFSLESSSSCRSNHVASSLSLSLLCGMAIVGCSELEQLTTPSEPFSLTVLERKPRPSEAHFRSVAEMVPEYGGHYYDEYSNLVVWLTSSEAASRAREALEYQWSRDVSWKLRGERGRFEVRIGAFSFLELEQFRSLVEDKIFLIPGVVWLDLDEVANRLTVGVHGDSVAAATSAVQEFMASVGIPDGAWGVEQGTRLIRSSAPGAGNESGSIRSGAGSDLQDYKVHLRAGFQIGYYDNSGVFKACTIGMLMRIGPKPVALTASHCSKENGSWTYSISDPSVAADGTMYGQPGPTGFGFELYDMPRWDCGAPGGCIPADANVIEVTRAWADSVQFLSIANALAGDHYEDDTVAPYEVVGEFGGSTAGVDVFKVGRTTGKSAGTVHKTCVDFDDHPMVRCVDTASPTAAGGDSGAPVFSIITFGSPEVIFAGIQSGRSYHWTGSPHWDIAFSPMQQIREHYWDLEPLIHY